MLMQKGPVLVFGATGQQGGSVARALLSAGWEVRAFVRDPAGEKARALEDLGARLALGDLADEASVRAAMNGAYGVFSVQPSSGQGELYGVSDEQEVRYGASIADCAVDAGVYHFVYSSTNAAGNEPSGMGHFDSKAVIEQHIRSLPLTATIVRPASFMEMLTMPGFGLPEGHFAFFMRPDQAVQVIAVEDIGRVVASVFANRERFSDQTFEIASDTITGRDLAAAFSEAAGRPIAYLRFPDEVLAGNPFLGALTALVDSGRLAGKADLSMLRALVPDLQTLRSWLAGSGKHAFRAALGAEGEWAYGNL